MRIRLLLALLTLSAVSGLALPVGEAVKAACGGQVRLVWCQDAGDGTDTGAQGNALRLMGFDPDDGRGERRILAGLSNYAKPLLTPDGRKIIFSNRQEQKIYAVGFDGSGLKPLASGFALAVWRDAATETDWVYAGAIIANPDSLIGNVRRFRLDKPEVSENVWSKTPLNIDNFQLSASGRQACGTFPWPACGVAALPDGEWKKMGDGCWPALSPDDNLLMWIFDGAHRNLTMIAARTDERWAINISCAPGIDGFEVYHPRWSSHPRCMVMTGPYKTGEGHNRIRGGGRGVEIYLGKFSGDYKKIEQWIRVTHNQYADFFPDMWVAAPRKTAAPACPVSAGEVCALPAENDLPEKKKVAAEAWPISFDQVFFCWQNRARANSFTDPAAGRLTVCRVTARGRARYGRHFEMMPAGGAFIADGGAGELLAKCAANRQLGIEVMITPDSTGNTNLLPIIGYAAGSGAWNFLLGQRGGRLFYQLRAEHGGLDYLFDLGKLELGKASHVIVSCSAASAAGYLNGAQVFSADSVYGGNWAPGRIVCGNELLPDYAVAPDGTRAGWRGMLENIAIYARWIGPAEALKKYRASAAQTAGRKNPPGVSVQAALISEPAVPAPAAIAPYRRALAAAHYRIEKIIEGKCAAKEILAARWVILDGKTLEPRSNTGPDLPSLRLELFSDHPELEGERLIMEGDRYDLPLYYVVAE